MLTLPEAAARLRVSARTLEREVRAGWLAVVRIRRARRISRAAVGCSRERL